jgi:hypothetical protein
VTSIKGSGRITKSMDKGKIVLAMGIDILAIIQMVYLMAREIIIGQMEASIKESFSKVLSMEKGYSFRS